MIYTSYFANWRGYPNNGTPISIAQYKPIYYKGEEYTKLAPPPTLLDMWHRGAINEEKYREIYMSFLKGLSVEEVVNDLIRISNGRVPILICYEKKGEFCHRHIVAEWLSESGYEVKEV